jgi:hypothetical protein
MKRFALALLAAPGLLVAAGCGSDIRGATAPSCPRRYDAEIRKCESPDHAWTVSTKTDSNVLILTRTASGTRVVVRHVGCCVTVAWVKPHELLFIGEYAALVSLNPPSQRRTVMPGVEDFSISPDGRWIGIEILVGRHHNFMVAEVLPVGGGTCRRADRRYPSNGAGVSFSGDSTSLNVYWEITHAGPYGGPMDSLQAAETPISSLSKRCLQRR